MFKGVRSSVVVALLVFAAGLALAACGSSSSSSSASASGANAAATGTTTSSSTATPGRGGPFSSLTAAQRTCLKSHGVTLPTGGRFRPGVGTGTFTTPSGGTPPNGGTFTGPSGGTPPGGTSTTGGPPAGGGFFGGGLNSTKDKAAFTACGVTLPTGGFGAGTRAGVGGGAVSSTAIKAFVACVRKNGYDLTGVNTSGKGAVLPRSLQTNKKFLAAARSCTSLLRPTGAPGTSTTAAASSA